MLIAEDELVVAMVIKDELSDAGYQVTCAQDGVAALEQLAAGEFDALVTDIRMPRLCGVGLVRSVGELGLRLPVVVFSGHMTQQDRSTLRNLGVPAAAMLEKPVGLRALKGALNSLLQSHSASGAL